MATLYVTEFQNSGINTATPGQFSIAYQPPQAEQTVAIGAGSVQSAAFNSLTKFIRLHTDVICSIEIGPNPTATATKARLAANQTEYFAVLPGAGWQVAVITNT